MSASSPHGQRGAKVDVGQQPLARIGHLLVRRIGEQRAGAVVPVLRRGQRQVFLALEVVEEAALGQAGGGAQVVDRGRAVALAADRRQRGVEPTGAGVGKYGCHGDQTVRYGAYIPLGMESSDGDQRRAGRRHCAVVEGGVDRIDACPPPPKKKPPSPAISCAPSSSAISKPAPMRPAASPAALAMPRTRRPAPRIRRASAPVFRPSPTATCTSAMPRASG